MDANKAHATGMASAYTSQIPQHHHHHHLSTTTTTTTYHQNPNPMFDFHHHPPPGVVVDTIISPPSALQSYDPNYPYQQHSYSHSQSQINTLFISGLPFDVQPREIHNLFRRRQFFDFCQLEYTGRGKQVVAFATFFNHQAAIAAMNALNGVIFDPQSGSTLHIELARSNSRSKRSRGSGAYFIIDKRIKESKGNEETSISDGDDEPDEPSGTIDPNSSNKDLATAESAETAGDLGNDGIVAKEQSEKNVAGGLAPCSTLFIANLGPTCTEEELKQALSQFSGFHIVKMRANRGMPVAFADFGDVDRATEAMESLQGSTLPSSDRGGMHLEYARSKMRKV